MAHHKPGNDELSAEALVLRRLKSLIERIHEATGRALREIDQVAEPRSARWRCQNCGHRLHFTKPCRVVACNHCKVCGDASWIAVDSNG
jgi:hypothetical protein